MNLIKRNIPNSVTCSNLLAGTLAIIAAFHSLDTWWWGLPGYQVAFVMIALAAVFDFFDGLTARWLHSASPLGKELDSLCDLVSFGLAPALILYNMMLQVYPGCGGAAYVALLLPAFGALRLANFNIDTRQSTVFTGLPIPANAIFWMGFTAFLATHPHALPLWATLATIVALSLLMVCGLRMFSLKLHSLSPKSAWRQYLLVIAFLALVLLLGLAGLAPAILLYVALSALTKQEQ